MIDFTGQELGNYRLIRLLSRGKFSDVYLGEHVSLGTHAAIKVLPSLLQEDAVNTFLIEARIASSLDHPHIIHVLDFEVQQDRAFLIMDYAPNGTAAKRYPPGTPLPLHTIVEYTNQAASALQYAHNQNLIHRNIKPENMLLGRNNEILLSDFGMATILQSTRIPDPQELAGSAAYMAPEQLQGKPCAASDQYALAIIVYQWITGRLPFQGSLTGMVSQHLFQPPPPLRTSVSPLSPAIDEVVLTALAKNPDQRFPSVQNFGNALQRACIGTPSSPAFTPLPTNRPMSSADDYIKTSHPQPSPQVQRPFSVSDRFTPIPATQLSPPDSNQAVPVQQPPAPFPIGKPPVISAKTLRLPGKNNKWRNILLVVMLLLLLLAAPLFWILSHLPQPVQQHTSTRSAIGGTQLANGEYIGLSDGTFAFDTNRPDGELKRQAADKLKSHDAAGAEQLWQAALATETNDAEALIYLEDQRVLDSGAPFITLILGTLLTTDNRSTWSTTLQGAYVAQKEFNDGAKLPAGVKVRLLIANSSSSSVDTVARQIVQESQVEKTIVGVMGWPFGSDSKKATGILSAAHIPMVSPSASSDLLTHISPYFFRVVPPDEYQARVGAIYAEQVLHAKRASIFVNPDDTYSQRLAADFQRQFVAGGNSIVNVERYAFGQPATFPVLLQNAWQTNPDLIYFAGYDTDAGVLLSALPTSGPFAHVQVLGGEALYPSHIYKNITRLHFTSFAHPDEWRLMNLLNHRPAFFTEYPNDFDPQGQHPGNTQGFSRADTNTMLSYDATLALLTAGDLALKGGKKIITVDDLRQGLTQITTANWIQGTSGQIAFDANGNPINKIIILLNVDDFGNVKIEFKQGDLWHP